MSSRVGTRGALASMLLVAACHGTRVEPEPDVAVPEEWASGAPEGEAAVDEWWDFFEEPRLAAAVEEALVHNRDLAAAATRVEQAAALARIAGADRLPAVGIGASASRNQNVFVGLPVPGGSDVLSTTATSYGVSIDITWEADLWGGLRARERGALLELDATSSEYLGAQLSLAAQTAKAWGAWAEAREQVALSEDTVASFDRSARLVRDRWQRGLAPAIDVRLAESNLAIAEALLEARLEQIERIERQLELLMGRHPAGEVGEAPELPALPGLPPPGLPSELLERRPDLIAARNRLASADERLWEAKAARLPRLPLTASYGRTSDSLEDLIQADFTGWSLAGSLLQPVFQGGRLKAGVDLADARLREQVFLYEGAVLSAFAEVETALAVESHLAGREGHLFESARQAQAAARIAEGRYEAGLGTILEMLESQRRALQAEGELLIVRRERFDARVDLFLALGGGFPEPSEDELEDSVAPGGDDAEATSGTGEEAAALDRKPEERES
jgi:NodT family efflux transporter outer membrane factor (OMF) lipoprotein